MVGFKERELDITADDRIFTPRGVGALNIGVVQCLSELVANALDWRRPSADEILRIKEDMERGVPDVKEFVRRYRRVIDAGPAETVIKIRYNGDSIEVWDNGIGMTLDELEMALRLRGASDERRIPLRSRKGMYGMGMKVGILGLGWKFAIRTRSLIDGTESSIEIDTHEIENGHLKLGSIIGRVSEEPDLGGPLGSLESGTYIRIEHLHKRHHRPEIWREELGRNFSPEIKYHNIKIIIVDNSSGNERELAPCEPDEIPIVPGTKVILDKLDLVARPDYGGGQRGEPMKIRGWLALRQTSASGSGLWGIHTFRKGQLVEAFHKAGPDENGLLPKRPHPTYARLHGEVHLDMCDPNFTKVGWNTELQSWKDAQRALQPILERMLKASKEYRASTDGGAKSRKIIQGLRRAAKQAVSLLSQDFSETAAGGDVDTTNCVPIDDSRRLLISVAQTQYDDPSLFWEYSYRPESDEMCVFVNTASALWQWAVREGDEKISCLIVNWAIVDSLYFCLVNEMAVDPNYALSLRNKWHATLYGGEVDD